ncbi:hypothetical protein B0T26DRAFT_876754 [Lasiosphaeria miniovina]|uniref:Uncharacterized protein n=1 Tax=Lasiosphaeria miniovina TaxID=1954250 RepID=A0AA39ZUB9_9PEZI|nr:uncharacterized protein B0T26DRAFT_876754 [Lasiosphaeria miniovina]KAK0703889.1 hypothetical protein B0T26DRAFT_876754 [Lasiosphaeria miniovina]
MGRTRLPLVCLLLCMARRAACGAVCYNPDGTVVGDKYIIACNSAATGESGSHSACCNQGTGDICMSTGVCVSSGSKTPDSMIWINGCTDSTWRDPVCAQYCNPPPNATKGYSRVMKPCGEKTWCCSGAYLTDAECCQNSFMLIRKLGTVVRQLSPSDSPASANTPATTDAGIKTLLSSQTQAAPEKATQGNSQSDGQSDGQTNGDSDSQTNNQSDSQTNNQSDSQTNNQTNNQTNSQTTDQGNGQSNDQENDQSNGQNNSQSNGQNNSQSSGAGTSKSATKTTTRPSAQTTSAPDGGTLANTGNNSTLTPSDGPTSKNNNTAPIIGGVLGSLLLAVSIALAVAVMQNRRLKRLVDAAKAEPSQPRVSANDKYQYTNSSSSSSDEHPVAYQYQYTTPAPPPVPPPPPPVPPPRTSEPRIWPSQELPTTENAVNQLP